VHPLFPQSIDILCKEIGDDRFSNSVKIGCEGRGLLDSLGYHNQGSFDKQRKEIHGNYVNSFKKWLRQGQPETPTECKVFGFLGQRTDIKVALAEKLVNVVHSGETSVFSLRRLIEDVCRATSKDFENLVRTRYLGRPFNCIKCLSEEVLVPECQCYYSMFIDASILCAGAFGAKRSMFDDFRRFIEESILAYSVAINSWLEETLPKRVTFLTNARYISKDYALEIAEGVYSSLGEKGEVKEWLTACLLKTVKDNQRWHKRTELIDDFAEATSYLREML
jgi:hypothetical protein